VETSEPSSPAELLDAWRDALRAAQEAERLALAAVAVGHRTAEASGVSEAAVEVLAVAERLSAHARHVLDGNDGEP
jgi:hypothetical protein